MPDASVFNAWHADVASSAACDLVFQRALGLSPEVVSNSLLTWAGIADITAVLRLAPGQTLVDLACGRGGYSQEVARRTGACLVGLDFSAVAVAIAEHSTDQRARARFCVGDFTAVGLRDDSADAVMCIDAFQFSESPLGALAEWRRILVPGGRLAITGWEPIDPDDQRVPERIRRMNLAHDLAEAGFEHIEVTGKPDWHAAERGLWQVAVQTDADGDPGLAALREEGTHVLETFDAKRRVLGTATAPLG
jgi:SAM-dependent methyltransferase